MFAHCHRSEPRQEHGRNQNAVRSAMRRSGRTSRHPRLESLESRCLMAASPKITEFPVQTPLAGPEEITAGPDGNLWFTGVKGSSIGRITPAGVIKEFPIPTSQFPPEGITSGPDGNLWFTEYNGGIGRITPTGTVTMFVAGSSAGDITTGPDGNLWFTLPADGQAGEIGSIAPTNRTTAYPTVVPGDADVVLPNGVASYPADSTIPANTLLPVGTVTFFTLSGSIDRGPLGITAGPDGNLWFTEYSDNQIGRITPDGAVTEFPTPTPGSQPQALTAGPDGNLWFTELNGNNIGRITPSGTITEFAVPSPNALLESITAGPDGNLWFTEDNTDNIGRITPAGAITEFSVPTLNSALDGITAGPDGNIWFTDYRNSKIGLLQLPPLTATATTISATEGAPFSGVVGSFTDPDIQGTPSDFQATINWGDGTKTAGQISEDASHTFYVTGSHTYAEYGSGLKVSVSIADEYGRNATVKSTANVLSNAPLVPLPVSALPTLPKGTLLSGVEVASFTDRNPATSGTFWATIDWGDGSPESTGIITQPSGKTSFLVRGDHTYLMDRAAPYVVTVTVHDQGGATLVTKTTATVTNRSPLVTGIPVKMTRGLPFSAAVAYIVEGLGLPSEPASDYAATINWGDGSKATAGTVAAIPGGDWVVGNHTYAKSGPYTITVTVKEGGLTVVGTAEAFDPPGGPGGPLHHAHRGKSRVHHRSQRSLDHTRAGLDRLGN
jgi:streptogramin lyase